MKRLLTSALVVALVGSLAALGLAAYPDRPVKLIVPWAAGGDTDNIFRPFTPAFQKALGATVVIANVTGASGTVGAREANTALLFVTTRFALGQTGSLTGNPGFSDVNYTDF